MRTMRAAGLLPMFGALLILGLPDLGLANRPGSAHVRGLLQVQGNDFSIEMTAAPSPAFLGNELTYTITVVNHGPGPEVADSGIWDHLPKNSTLVSIQTDDYGCSQFATHFVQCLRGPLDVGVPATVTIVVTPTKVGKITNQAEARVEVDPIEANNVARVTTIVNPKPIGGVDTGGGGTATREPPLPAIIGLLTVLLLLLLLAWRLTRTPG